MSVLYNPRNGGIFLENANPQWPTTFEEARALQESWAPRVRAEGEPSGIRHVAGVDLSCLNRSSDAWAAVVVIHAHSMETVEVSTAAGQMTFPYVPGFLSFREGPVIWEAIKKVTTDVDLWFFDGQGLAHPRRFGLASHMGLLLERPSIGVAKSLYVGNHGPLGEKAGRRADLVDQGADGDEVVGQALRTRDRVAPVYVSPGHLISIRAATDWTMRVTRGLRIPEPTRRAHMEVNRFRRECQG